MVFSSLTMVKENTVLKIPHLILIVALLSWVLLISFYRWENQGFKIHNKFFRVSELESSWSSLQIQVSSFALNISFSIFGCPMCHLEYDFVVRPHCNLEAKWYSPEIQIAIHADLKNKFRLKRADSYYKVWCQAQRGSFFFCLFKFMGGDNC